MIPLWLRTRARRSPMLLNLYLLRAGHRHLGVHPGRTQICIEAYPRSANSSTFRKFRIANPDSIVAHHTHTVANLVAAARNRVPTLVLIREPPEPILSALVAMRAPRIDDAIERYLDFYRWIERHLDDIVLADFETVLSDWNGVMRKVNERFGTSFLLHEDEAEADRIMESFIRDRMDAESRSRHITNMPLPSEERDELKNFFRGLVDGHPRYPDVEDLYRRLRPRCVAV